MEIHGIPQVENENLLDRVNDVAQKLRVSVLSETSIHMQCIGYTSSLNRIPGVIENFSRQATRDHWLDNMYNLKETEITIYAQENMMQKRGLGNMVINLHGTKMEVLIRKKDGNNVEAIENDKKLRYMA